MTNTNTASRPKRAAVRSPLAFELVLSLAAGALSSLAAANSRKVTASINTPPFQPPSWVFPVVWTILFILMGISAWMTANSSADRQLRKSARSVYLWQLLLNILWSVIFFRLRLFYAAVACIFFLWLAIIVMLFRFGKCSRTAALMQIPYFAWVTFAVILTRAVAIMN